MRLRRESFRQFWSEPPRRGAIVDYSSGVAGVVKQEEGHWVRAKIGAWVHFNLATPLSPSGGRGLAVVMEGERRPLRFYPTGDQTTRCTPSAKPGSSLWPAGGISPPRNLRSHFSDFFSSKKSPPKTQGRHPPGGGAGPPCRPADPRRPCYTKA